MEKRRYRRREDWKVLIEAQRESGLSAAEFCRQQKINAKYFSKRKTEYRNLTDKAEVPSTFVEIPLPIQTTQPTSIHVHYKNTHLQIPSNVSSAWLADFLGLLS